MKELEGVEVMPREMPESQKPSGCDIAGGILIILLGILAYVAACHTGVC